MDMITIILGGGLTLFLLFIISGILYIIIRNLINGRKFHYLLEQEFSKLRLSKMLTALGLSKKDYIYQTRVPDIQRQMNNCSDCTNTVECDEELSAQDIDISNIEFCDNEAELKGIKQRQSTIDTETESTR